MIITVGVVEAGVVEAGVGFFKGVHLTALVVAQVELE